jgi:2-oxoisovalerate dehydrogenase E2 component (dihydrolipoyl transacylase)
MVSSSRKIGSRNELQIRSVKPLASVQTFDPICEVQSDKATVEITSPYDGVIKEIVVQEGDIARVGSALCHIELAEEEEEAATDLGPQTSIEEVGAKSQVVGETTQAPKKPEAPQKRKHPMDPSNEMKSTGTDAHVLATPSVRHFARSMGIHDMSVLAPGSGRNGRVEKADIDTFLARGTTQSGQAKEQVSQILQDDVRLELGRTRYAMWKAMTKSLEIPHFGYSSTLDLTALAALLPSMNLYIPPQYNPPTPPEYPPPISPNAIWGSSSPTRSTGDPNTHFKKLTVLPLLLKTLSRAMQEWAVFRSSLNPQVTEDERPSLTVRPHSDIAIAVSTASGLYTPVITSVDTKTPYEIMGELKRFQSLGRRMPAAFTPKEIPKRGATISVSNVGAIGNGEWAAPLLVPGGGVAIVAIGRAKWVDRMGEKRLEVGVSWSADHRIVEGAEMAAFVESWRSWVEDPARLIADGR